MELCVTQFLGVWLFSPVSFILFWGRGYEKPHSKKDKHFFSLFYNFYIYLHTYVYIVLATSPLLPPPPAFRQNLFCTLVLQFCWREYIRHNKKDSVLLAGGKGSYTELFLALLPCTCVLQPTLVRVCQTSLVLPGPLPIVASASLWLLY
jgi:hypothetical protein